MHALDEILLPSAPDAGLTIPAIDADLLDAARRAMAPNSWRALGADLAVFAVWCGDVGAAPFHASPETVAQFISAQIDPIDMPS